LTLLTGFFRELTGLDEVCFVSTVVIPKDCTFVATSLEIAIACGAGCISIYRVGL